MSKWSDSSFIDKSIDTSLVFYPFSGPDFLHSYYLYPNANEYILLALEDIGNIPKVRAKKFYSHEPDTVNWISKFPRNSTFFGERAILF